MTTIELKREQEKEQKNKTNSIGNSNETNDF